MRRQTTLGGSRRGFTLIELMIVIAIIAIIAAVAIPNLLRSRAMANEARVLGNLRSLYSDSIDGPVPFGFWQTGGYNYQALDQLTWQGVDAVQYGGDYDWGVLASPLNPGATGFRSFWVDNRGMLRVGNGDYDDLDFTTWASSTSLAAD